MRGSCWWPGWHCYTKVAWFRLHQWYSVQCTQLPVHHCTPLYNLEISSLTKVNAQAGIRSVTESVDDEDDEDDLLSIINCDNINTGWSSTSRLMIFDFYSFVEFFSSLKALNHQQTKYTLHNISSRWWYCWAVLLLFMIVTRQLLQLCRDQIIWRITTNTHCHRIISIRLE